MPKFKISKYTINLTPTALVLIILAIVFILGLMLRFITPQTTLPPQQNPAVAIPPNPNLELVNSNQMSIIIRGEIPEIPEKLPILVAAGPVDMLALSGQIAVNLNMTKSPDSNNRWLNSELQQSLYYTHPDLGIQFQKATEDTGQILNENQASAAATAFVNENLSLDGITFEITDIEPGQLDDHEHHVEEASTDPTLFKVRFAQKYNQYPLTFGYQSTPQANIWVGPGYEVIKATIHNLIRVAEEQTQLDTIPINQLREMINKNQGVLLRVSSDGPSVPINETVRTIYLQDFRIEYRQPNPDAYILPYLRASGVGVMESGLRIEVEYTIPLVRTTN